MFLPASFVLILFKLNSSHWLLLQLVALTSWLGTLSEAVMIELSIWVEARMSSSSTL